MRVTPYLQVIEQDGYGLCYHSLRGNLFLLEPPYLRLLNKIKKGNKREFTQSDAKRLSELIDAGYIVDKQVNEREFLAERNKEWMKKVIGGGQLRLLNLMIAEECNFGCRHCLHKCSVQTSSTHGNRKLMDWQTAKMAIDAYHDILQRWGNEHLNVHFGSAEPLINWPVLKNSVRYIRSFDDEAQLAVNTNLSLLTVAMAEFLRDNHVYISTSLDGPPEGNDAIRIFKNGKGTFDAIVSKFKMLAEIFYPLDGFSITINDLNFDALNSVFINWARDHGFRGIACDIDLINTVNATHSFDDCIEKLMEIRHACQENGMENFGTWTTAYDNLVNEPEDDMPTFCKAVKGRNISVNPSGRVFICGHTNTCLGDLANFDEIFNEDKSYFKLVESRLPGNDPMCYVCKIEGVCAGQCQITREVANATNNSKDILLCNFYRKATMRLLQEKLTAELIGN